MSVGLQLRSIQGNPFLTKLVLGYARENGFVAPQLAPVMDVAGVGISGSFYVIDFAAHRRALDTVRGLSGQAPSSSPPVSTGTFSTKEHAHKTLLTKQQLDVAMQSVTGFKQIMKIHQDQPVYPILYQHEKELVTLLTTTGTYLNSTLYTTVGAGDRWDESTSKPQSDVITYARNIHKVSGIARKDLTLVLGPLVYDALIVNSHVKEQVKYVSTTNARDMNLQGLAQYFDVKNVITAEEQEITSNINLTETQSYLWGKNAFLVHIEEPSGPTVPVRGSFYTMSTMGTAIPRARTSPSFDPEGDWFHAEARFGVTAGAKTGEGLRTAAWLGSVVN